MQQNSLIRRPIAAVLHPPAAKAVRPPLAIDTAPKRPAHSHARMPGPGVARRRDGGRAKILWLLAGALLLNACVTINVYFPAAAAEDAAREFIRGIKQAPGPDGGDQQGRLSPAPWQLAAVGLLQWISTRAAAEGEFSISSPGAKQLQQSMRQRYGQLLSYLRSGALGLKADGTVVLRDPKAVPIQERNSVRQLVAEENRDRNALYQEVARANGHPEWESQIRRTFARQWINQAEAGTWYEAAPEEWKRK